MQKQRVADQVAERIERLIVDGARACGRCAGAASSTPSMAVGRSSPISTATPTPAR